MPHAAFTLVLALITMVGPLGIDTYLPSFPAIAAEFQASPVVVQQTLSLYVAGLAVMMLFYGTLSDSFGRRRVMLISMVGFAALSALAVFAGDIRQLVALRLLQGLTAGAGIVIARAMVQDRFQGADAQRTSALIMVVFGLAPALAPILGGWLQAHFGWRATFVFLASFTTLLLLVSLRVLPETLPPAARQRFHLGVILRNYGRSLAHPHFLPLSVGLALIFAGIPLYVGSAAAFVMGILHQPETAFGWLFWPLVGGLTSGSALASRLAHRVPMRRLIGIGFGLMLTAATVNVTYNLFFTASVPWAVMPMALYAFGVALSMPGMSVTAMEIFPEMRGLAASMQGFLQMMLFALVTGVLAPHIFHSALWLALAQFAFVFVGVTLWRAVADRRAAAVAALAVRPAAGGATIAP